MTDLNLIDETTGARRVVVDGRPSWLFGDGTVLPVFEGGADDDADDSDDDQSDSDDADDLADLGEKGKKALAAERAAAAKAKQDAKKDRERAEAAEAKLAEIEQQNLSDQEKAVTAARDEGFAAGKKEATEALLPKLLEAKVAAVAADKLAISASKAVRLMDLDDIDIGEDGSVDEKAIIAKVDELLEAEPHLKKDSKAKPSADGGARSGNGDDPTVDLDARKEKIKQMTGIGSGGKE